MFPLVCSRCRQDFVSDGEASARLCPACRKLTAAKQRELQPTVDQASPPEMVAGDQVAPNPAADALTLHLPLLPGYEVVKEIGRGGMGVVYQARQLSLDRLVAVKSLQREGGVNPTQLARFEQEARATARLRHPNIVTVYDFLHTEGTWFLVMELLDGEDLEQGVLRQGPFDEWTTWAILRQVASGLDYALQHGLIHRDIKPANLFLGAAAPPGSGAGNKAVPQVKITDFGLALLASPGTGEQHLTRQGVILGTPAFMAPEQFSTSHVDWRADLYALGATAVFLLTGEQPYGGLSLWEVMMAKTVAEPPVSFACSDASRHILGRMMATDPLQRFASYPEFLAAVDEVLLAGPSGAVTGGAPVGTSLNPLPPAPQTRPAPKLGIPGRFKVVAVVVVVGLTLGGLFSRQWSPPEPVPPQVTAGKSVYLFNGKNLAGWLIDRGNWQPTTDEEGGTVLAGTGLIRRPLPERADYRLLMGMDLRNAAAVEVHFGLAGAGREALRYVVHIAATEATLGERHGDRGDPRVVARKPVAHDGSSLATPYRELRLDRFAGKWHVFYDGQWIGSVPTRDAELAEFRLRCDAGTPFFETIEVIELSAAQ